MYTQVTAHMHCMSLGCAYLHFASVQSAWHLCCMYVCTPLLVLVYIQAISKLRATLSGADDDQGIVGTTPGSVNIVRDLAVILTVPC